MNKFIQFFRTLKAGTVTFWNSLPHAVQSALVLFGAAAVASLGKTIADPANACWQWHCIRQYLGIAIGSGLAALRAFYMNPPNKSVVTVTVPEPPPAAHA
jgi:hypothetical protein